MKNQQITLKKYHPLIIFFLFIAVSCGGGGGTTSTPPPDTTAPSITLSVPANSASISSLSQVVIDFSEEVLNADQLANYTLGGIGQGTLSLQSVSVVATQATLNISGLVGNGAITLDLQNITDVAGNALLNPTLSFTGTTTSPTQTALPASGILSNSLTSVTITYSKEVTGADVLANYTLSGSGVGSLSPSAVTLVTPAIFEYRLDFTGTPADGAVTLSIANIQDLVGNPLSGAQINYTFDVTGPVVTTLTPGTGSTLNQISGFDITYSEPVTGATIIANHTLSGTAVGTLQVASVAANVSPANSYHVSLSGAPATTGTLNFSVQNVTDALGNVMTPAAASYTIDQINPTATASLTPGTWINALSTLDISFSEPVLNAASTSSYSLSGSVSSLALQSVTGLGGNAYRLAFTGTPSSGSLGVNLSGSTQITDLSGNPIAPTSFTYNTDTVRPTVTSIAPYAMDGTGGLTGVNAITRSYLDRVDITYSEAMTGATQIGNYSLSGTALGTLQLSTAGTVSGNTYSVYFTGKPAGTGTVILTMNAVDQAGNTVATPITYQIVPEPIAATFLSTVSGTVYDIGWNGTSFVTVGGTASVGKIFTGTDGINWTAGTGCSSKVLRSVTWANSIWVAVGENAGKAIICSSTDGITWSAYTAFENTYATSEMRVVYWHPSISRFVAIGRGTSSTTEPICTSSANGTAWETVHVCTGANSMANDVDPVGIGGQFLTGMAGYGPALSSFASYAPATFSFTWTANTTGSLSSWNIYSIASSVPLNKKVIVGDAPALGGIVMVNSGLNYYQQNVGPLENLRDVSWNGSSLLILGVGGTVITSTDGATWSMHRLGSSTDVHETAVWQGSYWLVGTDTGTIYKFQ